MDLRVGDILELHDDEVVPTDCLLLTTGDARGECFIQTAQLDGERNLKPKFCIKYLEEHMEELLKSG